MRDPSDYNVRAVERALQILECFDDRHPERGVSEISEEIGLHKATTYRILTTLMNYGYIERAADGQKYRLGLRLSELGFKVVRRMDLRKEALPLVQQLLDQLGETCDLCVYDHGRVFYLDVLQSRHAVTVAATPGQRLPVHCTASGKLFLAYLPADEVEPLLSGKLPATLRIRLLPWNNSVSKWKSFGNKDIRWMTRNLRLVCGLLPPPSSTRRRNSGCGQRSQPDQPHHS